MSARCRLGNVGKRYSGTMRVLHGKDEAARTLRRGAADEDAAARESVLTTLRRVREEGDAVLRELTARFDGVKLETFLMDEAAFGTAARQVPSDLQRAIERAAARVRAFHEAQPAGGFLEQTGGSLLGQLVRPLERVACYVPGGSAPLFSTLLMTAVPAQVAGAKEVVVATPPREDGSVAPEILVTASLLGITKVYRLGGAQAVAALAYGTQTVPKVDKIVGPGNRFVVLAKQLVYGDVGVESLPGPTETLVLADDSADVQHVAADLLAQAEHAGAQPVLVTPSRALLEATERELERQLQTLSTKESAQESVEMRGFAVLVADLAEGLEVANAYAPEHLCLLTRDPWSLVPQVKHAGGIFLGEYSMEALGDYAAGPSHVMPTGGTARFSSALNVRDFQKVIPLVNLGQKTLQEIGPYAAKMARAEGLEAHARAIESRLSPAPANVGVDAGVED